MTEQKYFMAAPAASRAVEDDEVRSIRASQVAELAGILAVPHSRAATLLREAAWNIEEAALRAMDAGEGGSGAGGGNGQAAPEGRAWKADGCSAERPCACCFDEDCGDGFETDCGSVFCVDCWRGYLRAILTSGSNIVVCPMPKCQTIVSEGLVRTVLEMVVVNTTVSVASKAGPGVPVGEVSNETLLKRYLSRQMSDYVTGSSDFRHCPGRDCESIVKRIQSDQTDVTCTKCGCAFCWKCLLESHSPLDCRNAGEWVLTSSSEAKSTWWIVRNTKACPRCHVSIFKNGGCNHMHCIKCGLHFNWDEPAILPSDLGATHDDATAETQKRDVEIRKRAAAFQKHQKEGAESRAIVELAETYAKAMGMDASVVTNAQMQIEAAHRDLRWVHMALYFHDCSAATAGLIEHNIAELEKEVTKLESSLSGSSISSVGLSVAEITKQSSLLDMYRRTIQNLAAELV